MTDKENKLKCLVCEGKSNFKETSPMSITFYPPFEDSFISEYTSNFAKKSDQIIKNEEKTIDCKIYHQECKDKFKKEENCWTFKKIRNELRTKMSCDNCKNFLLKENWLSTLFYSIPIPQEKESTEQQFKYFCPKCWDEKRELRVENDYEETLLNENELVNFSCSGSERKRTSRIAI